MIWQDIVMMIVGFTFSFSLLPSLMGRSKPARSTCILTASGLAILTFCMATLGLWLTFLANLMTTIVWFGLAIQRRNNAI